MNRALPRLHLLAAGVSILLGVLALFVGVVDVVVGVVAVALQVSSSSAAALASEPASALLVVELLLRPPYEMAMNAWRVAASVGVLGCRPWGRPALVGWANVRLFQSLVFIVIEARWAFMGPDAVLPLLTATIVMAFLLDVVPAWVLWCMSSTRRGTFAPLSETPTFGRSAPVVSAEDKAWFIASGKSLLRLSVGVAVVAAMIGNLAVVAAINAPSLARLVDLAVDLATA